MNLIVLHRSQFISDTSARLDQRQATHVKNILRATQHQTLQIGVINENLGCGKVHFGDAGIELHDIVLNKTPPPQLPVTLVLGMPRPQMIKRILQTVACLGVKELLLFQSSRVEKSFWQSPSAQDDAILQQLQLGLEQGVATQLPSVRKFTRFRPFIEDNLPHICSGNDMIIAHPGDGKAASQRSSVDKHLVLAVGPEGGFIEKEVASFCEIGFEPVQLGTRILKVETAVPVLLAKLFEFK